MEQSLFEQLITLYILYYLENYNSAYNLMKPLSRKFGIFEFSRVTNNLIENVYLTKKVEGQMGYYIITHDGEVFLKAHLNELRQELEEKYLPNDPGYIQRILSCSRD